MCLKQNSESRNDVLFLCSYVLNEKNRGKKISVDVAFKYNTNTIHYILFSKVRV